MVNQKPAAAFRPIQVTADQASPGAVTFGPVTLSTAGGGEDVPEEIPFRFTEQHLDILLDIVSGERVVLTGHTGCGKTTALEQIAARLRQGVVVISMSEATDPATLLGGYVARRERAGDLTSSTIFEDGPLVRAMRLGLWVIMDEMDFAHPGVMTVLNSLTPTTRSFLNQEVAGGERLAIHENFRIMGTANTVGPMADYRHLYSGTPPMNPAQLERYRVHVIDYLDPDEEVEAVLAGVNQKSRAVGPAPSGVSREVVRPFVMAAGAIRELFIRGEIATPVSTRGIIHWVSLVLRDAAVYRDRTAAGDGVSGGVRAALRAAGPSILNKMTAGDAARAAEMIVAAAPLASLRVSYGAGDDDRGGGRNGDDGVMADHKKETADE